MARKKTEIVALRPDVPIYPIGVAARMLNVHPRTLRIYEAEGLIKPACVGTKRMFSSNDIQWITCMRKLIHEQGISIQGLKKLLTYAPCYELADCPAEIHDHCAAVVDRSVPRTLHQVGDSVARAEAKEADRAKEEASRHKKKSGNHKRIQPQLLFLVARGG
ncbi:MAG: MerR family transcriptional regulator [Deltaproteobacteria bacterium]|nr:MAG: MerR family transcriptional regulator [Deltaproteobacteria bacterium]